MTLNDIHPYVEAAADDRRSPCPALNALANHGYLPHDGRNITLSQLVNATRRVYGLSLPLAAILSLGALARCGRWNGLHMTLDLNELTKHGVLEHDGSLVQHDTPPGATHSTTVADPVLLQQLLDTSDRDHLSREDLCRAQVARHAASRPLAPKHAINSKGELDLIHQVFGVMNSESESGPDGAVKGDSLVVPKAYLRVWFGEGKLPFEEGWHRPLRTIGVFDVVAHIKEISKVEQEIISEGKNL